MDEPIHSGKVLGGRYSLGARLGAGGWGSVYAAVQADLGRPVAIKVLHTSVALASDGLARFEREARAAAALGHPNIAQVSDFQANAGEPPFLVMELLTGATLGATLKGAPGRKIAPARMAWIAYQILAGLDVAHRAGIVHRDIKPDKVFLVAMPGVEDYVKLLDFGIAKLSGDTDAQLTASGTMLGSPAFMAPEQVKSNLLDHRVDLYAVGATMYLALSGRMPFDATTVHGLLLAITEERLSPLHELDPTIDPALSALVARAMHKDRDGRFATAEAMRHALEPWLGGMAAHASATAKPGGMISPASIATAALAGGPQTVGGPYGLPPSGPPLGSPPPGNAPYGAVTNPHYGAVTNPQYATPPNAQYGAPPAPAYGAPPATYGTNPGPSYIANSNPQYAPPSPSMNAHMAPVMQQGVTPAPAKGGGAVTVLLIAVVGLLLVLVGGGAGAWYFFAGRDGATVATAGATPSAATAPGAAAAGAAATATVAANGAPAPTTGAAGAAVAPGAKPKAPGAVVAGAAAPAGAPAGAAPVAAAGSAGAAPGAVPPGAAKKQFAGTSFRIGGGSFGVFEIDPAKAAVMRVGGSISGCYASTEFDAPDHQFTDWTFQVDPAGNVKSVRRTTDFQPHPKFDACMIGALRGVKFAATPAGGSPQINFTARTRDNP